jgi:hypothetical protein
MSDLPPLPEPGQVLWGEDLNAYLAGLEARMLSNESRITDLEAKPEMVYSSTAYQFSNAAPPATGNQLRLNNVDPVQATLIDLRKDDADGADRSNWLQMLGVGGYMRIQDWDNAAIWHRFKVTGKATFDLTNAQVSVTWDAGQGTLPNAKISVGFLSPLVLG